MHGRPFRSSCLVLAAALAAALAGAGAAGPAAQAAPPGAAWLLRSTSDAAGARQARPDVLDTPVLPGSVMKTVTLVAALESHVIQPGSARICRRVVTVDGHRYVCSHPDLKRPLTPAEALAYSCNDFFVSLAQTLSRTAVNDVRARIGLPPVAAGANFAAALVGLDGPRVSPRRLLDSLTRLVVSDAPGAARLSDSTRRVLLDGMRGAATYGSASELASRHVDALAKTGTAPMPRGGVLGLTVAFAPANRPRRGVIVVAPGAAGRDATSIAAGLLQEDHAELRVGSIGADGKPRVASMDIEEYVARVVAGEGSPQAPAAAQEALAIAARSFAVANAGRHGAEGFDVCDTTHCQVLRPATPASRRAAAATAGRVLLDGTRPAAVFYSASCGGHSERPSNVWPGAPDVPFLPAQPDGACGVAPAWTSAVNAGDLERALRAAGLKGTALRGLRVTARSGSGRVLRLEADGFMPSSIAGERFRLAVGRTLGWQLLKSTLFDLRRDARGYVFTGRGFGHGVGMCLDGASCRAAAGSSAAAILRFYYPGLTIGAAPTGAGAANTGGAPAGPDIALALPGAEEGERKLLTALIRRARDEVADRAGMTAPPSIVVTVHPTVASFARAARQPWWVAGATRGSAIDLLPVATLRQRGLLDRTVRHEVAHVIVDAAVSDKPMWVREGAALYFSGTGESPSGSAVVAGSCPADAEILKAASAPALRDAYARAERCFRARLAAGSRWTDIH